MEHFLRLLEWVAASWYCAYVLTTKGGPFNLFTRAREAGGGRWHGRTMSYDMRVDDGKTLTPMHDGLLDCIICLLPYVGFGWWLMDTAGYGVAIMPFAIAGLALWAHGYFGWIHFGGK